WKPIMEWDSPTHWVAWNAYGAGPDEILWRHQAGIGYLRYHTDRHGNVTALLDISGNVIEQYSYDAFGQATITDRDGNVDSRWNASSSVGNHFMFQGREYFSEIGLYDFRHRFYDPGFGHFLQSDPLGFGGGDANLFRYCGGDPVNRRDPFGLVGENTTTKPDPQKRTEGISGAEATTEREWVTASEVPTYDRSADNVQRDISALDRVGAATGEGSKGDTGGSVQGTITPPPTYIERANPKNNPPKPPANDPKDYHGIPYTSGIEDSVEAGALIGGILGAIDEGALGAAGGGLVLGPGGAFLGGFAGAVNGAFFGALGGAELGAAGTVLVNYINGHP
ncbi:MAG: RHS repeat-associated core domain-containing protein, partial [Chthoniobacterales bacterium]